MISSRSAIISRCRWSSSTATRSIDASRAMARLPEAELLALGARAGARARAAHEVGVTHRDLKPSNIMQRAGSGRAVITDFGLSRLPGSVDDAAGSDDAAATAELSLTRSGDLLGTPAYIGAEQLRRSPDVGPAADVYSARPRAVRGGHRTTRLSAKDARRADEGAPRGAARRWRRCGPSCRRSFCASSTTAW